MSLDGSVIGTPLFMAPEQARGQNKKIDGRTDIYALGVILYMMLVRRHPLASRLQRSLENAPRGCGRSCLPAHRIQTEVR